MNRVITVVVCMFLTYVPIFIIPADRMHIERQQYHELETLMTAHKNVLGSGLRFTCSDLCRVLITIDKDFFEKWKEREEMCMPSTAMSDTKLASFEYMQQKFKLMEECRPLAERFVPRPPQGETDYSLEYELAGLRQALQLDRILLQMYLYHMDNQITELCNSRNELYASFKKIFVDAIKYEPKNYRTLSDFFKFKFVGCKENKIDKSKNEFVFTMTASPFYYDTCYANMQGLDRNSAGTRYVNKYYDRIFDFYFLYVSWLKKCLWRVVQEDNFLIYKPGAINNFKYLLQKDPFCCRNMMVIDSGMYQYGYYYFPPEVIQQNTVTIGPIMEDIFKDDDHRYSNIVKQYFALCREHGCLTKEEAEMDLTTQISINM